MKRINITINFPENREDRKLLEEYRENMSKELLELDFSGKGMDGIIEIIKRFDEKGMSESTAIFSAIEAYWKTIEIKNVFNAIKDISEAIDKLEEIYDGRN